MRHDVAACFTFVALGVSDRRRTSRRTICAPCAVAFVRWHTNSSMLRGCTRSAKRINTQLYRHSVGVIVGEISAGSFFKSDSAAIGSVQFATGPQKWVDCVSVGNAP